MSPTNHSDQTDLLRALCHPLRRRILRHLADGETVSPRELSADLRQPLGNVRVLAECGAVKLVKARPAHGSVEHFYRSTVRAPWALQVLGLGESDRGGTGESSEGAST